MNYSDDSHGTESGASNCNYSSIHEFNETCKPANNFYTLINYNIRSFAANSSLFFPLHENDSMPDVIILTKTWLSNDEKEDINSYTGHRSIREGRSGGVSVYVEEHTNCHLFENFSFADDTIEICTVKIQLGINIIVVSAVYRPNSGTELNLQTALEDIVSNRNFQNVKSIVCGDCNADLLDKSDEIDSFLTFMQSNHFIPSNNKPTRGIHVTNFRSILLDHIWLDFPTQFVSGEVLSDITDHFPTFVRIRVDNPGNPTSLKISFRLNNEQCRESISEALATFDWGGVYRHDLNMHMGNFIRNSDKLYCNHFPLKYKSFPKKRFDNP